MIKILMAFSKKILEEERHRAIESVENEREQAQRKKSN